VDGGGGFLKGHDHGGKVERGKASTVKSAELFQKVGKKKKESLLGSHPKNRQKLRISGKGKEESEKNFLHTHQDQIHPKRKDSIVERVPGPSKPGGGSRAELWWEETPKWEPAEATNGQGMRCGKEGQKESVLKQFRGRWDQQPRASVGETPAEGEKGSGQGLSSNQR